jgi:sugar phosphate isomerase/epimerase
MRTAQESEKGTMERIPNGPRAGSSGPGENGALDETAAELLGTVQVHVPWRLLGRYRERFRAYRLNPEIAIDGVDLDRTETAHFSQAARDLHDRGCRVSLHGPFWDLCAGSRDPLIREVTMMRLHRFLDAAALFRPVSTLVCHLGYDSRHYGQDFDGWLERSLGVWEPLARRAEREELPILLENVWEDDPAMHRAVLERVASPMLGFCLDAGHAQAFSKTPVKSWLQELSPHLWELHLHDNDGSSDSHLPIGQGGIDFAGLFGFLEGNGFYPLLTLEPHRESHVFESLEGLARVVGKRRPVGEQAPP